MSFQLEPLACFSELAPLQGGSGGGSRGRAYEGWDKSLEHLRRAWAEQGPFQGVLGFSQGAAVAFLLLMLAGEGGSSDDNPFSSLRFGRAPIPAPIGHDKG